WLDLRTDFKRREQTSNSSTTNSKPAIVEATGWVKGKDGELYLVADNQTDRGVYKQPWNQIASCDDI
ncbi:MAG: hypothetical protein AAFW70_18245, partial [Cyanobacteria bacterium J06635_10]